MTKLYHTRQFSEEIHSSAPHLSPLSIELRIAWGAYSAIAATLGVVLFQAVNPGGITTDSRFQLQQALGQIGFNDWHPVIMSAVWGWLIAITGTIASMAAVQIGIAVLASIFTVFYLLRRTRSPWWALLGLLPVALPTTVNMWGSVWKDTQMAIAFFLATVLVLLIREVPRAKWWLIVGVVLAVAYGTLVRKNAIVGVPPLIALASIELIRARCMRVSWKRLIATFAVGCVAFVVIVGGAGAVLDATLKPTKNS